VTDESKLSLDASRGQRAQSLLDDELLTGAFKGLEEAYIATWRTTTIDDMAGREKLFLAINIVGKVRDHLISVVNDGKLAAKELRDLAQIAERSKRWQDVR
jgi:hypothetical protein